MKKKTNQPLKGKLGKAKQWLRKNWKKLVVGLGVVGLLVYFKSMIVVGLVNGRPVWRVSYVKEMERMAKNQAMESLLTKKLIEQEANKRKIMITSEEKNEELVGLEEVAKQQGLDLDQLLEFQGMSKKDLVSEIKLQKQLEKLVGDKVEVTDEEGQQYWEENAELYEGQEFEAVKDEIKEQLKQQKLSGEMQNLILELQSQAKLVKWL